MQSALSKARLYLIMDASPKRGPVEAFIESAISGGVDVIQLREKMLPDRELVALARRCAETCRRLHVPFIVNDRFDVALACGADGVHVGQDDLPAYDVRRAVGDDLIVGLSTHSEIEINLANCSVDNRLAVDYIGVGPVYETPTKQGRPAVGTGLVHYAALHAPVPFFAIGGLEPATIAPVIAAGATRLSVRRWIVQAQDPAAAARSLLEAYDRARAAAAR
jgi:thiamine-phosphate pyrophosphorylase